MHSFDTHLDIWDVDGNQKADLVWGDHRVQRFAKVNNQWVPVDEVSDPSGRLLRFEYFNEKLTQVQFEVGGWSSTWTLDADEAGRLSSVWWPQVTTDSGKQRYQVQIAYGLMANAPHTPTTMTID